MLGWLRPIVRAALRRSLRCQQEASDVTNEAQLLHKYRAQFHGESLRQFRAWARRIAANALVDHLRRKGRDVGALVVEPADHRPTAEPSELGENLAQALARLPLEQRQIVEARVFDGLQLEEVAARLGRPASTVRVYSKRGIENPSRQLRGEP